MINSRINYDKEYQPLLCQTWACPKFNVDTRCTKKRPAMDYHQCASNESSLDLPLFGAWNTLKMVILDSESRNISCFKPTWSGLIKRFVIFWPFKFFQHDHADPMFWSLPPNALPTFLYQKWPSLVGLNILPPFSSHIATRPGLRLEKITCELHRGARGVSESWD